MANKEEIVNHKQIDTGFYNQEVYLIFVEDGKLASDYINSIWTTNIDKVDMGNDCRGFQFKSNYNNGKYMKARFYVFIHPSDLENSTVDHELIHLTWDILDHLGIKLSNDNHEPMTYFYEYLITQIREAISEQIRRRNALHDNQ